LKVSKAIKMFIDVVDRDELDEGLKVLQEISKQDRQQKRQVWAQEVLQVAASHGDTRDPGIILREASSHGAAINAAFRDSTIDRETAETICLNEKWERNRKEPTVYQGEVLTRTNRFASPVLDPNRPY
jgi:hypothetical protein